jgi:hypothetical protein
MKRAISTFGLLAALFAVISLASYAADTSMTGWISDSHCGAKGMSADHKSCAETCIKTRNATWVFVDAKDKKVYPITNQDSVNADGDLGHEVTVKGSTTDDGSLKVDSIKPMKKPSS